MVPRPKLGGDSFSFLHHGPLNRGILPPLALAPTVATPLGIKSLISMCPIS